MSSTEKALEAEIVRLKGILADCRLELAAVRERQEEWAEETARHRRRRRDLEIKVRQIAEAADALLRSDGPDRRGRRLRAGRSAQRDISALEASPLFDGPWYLRQHPEVIACGLRPAEHYLLEGAAAGFRPGPDFDQAAYLRDHPDVRKSGENPLLHHLRS